MSFREYGDIPYKFVNLLEDHNVGPSRIEFIAEYNRKTDNWEYMAKQTSLDDESDFVVTKSCCNINLVKFLGA